VVVAAAQDAPTLSAVRDAARDGLAAPVLVGDKPAILALAAKLRFDLDPAAVHDQPDAEKAARLAVSLIREGRGDFLMKGFLSTAQLLKAVVDKENGLGQGRLMSHAAWLEVPKYHKMLVITDGGLVPRPTLSQKKEIIGHAVNMLLALGYERPIVGVLAGTEEVSPRMIETVDAAALKEMNQKGGIAGCFVEGPISLDLALVKEKAEIKKYGSPAAGEADILAVPDLCTGNCVSKALVEMGGARLAGLVLGARAPVVVTSRASSAEEKYLSLVLAAAACAQK
jgi:phosphate butyryltransferase